MNSALGAEIRSDRMNTHRSERRWGHNGHKVGHKNGSEARFTDRHGKWSAGKTADWSLV